jgi:hypothetical protein
MNTTIPKPPPPVTRPDPARHASSYARYIVSYMIELAWRAGRDGKTLGYLHDGLGAAAEVLAVVLTCAATLDGVFTATLDALDALDAGGRAGEGGWDRAGLLYDIAEAARHGETSAAEAMRRVDAILETRAGETPAEGTDGAR